MFFTSILPPVWKTKDYTLDVALIPGDYVIYYRREWVFFLKNEKGMKIKLTPKDPAELDYYIKVQKEKRTVRLEFNVVVT